MPSETRIETHNLVQQHRRGIIFFLFAYLLIVTSPLTDPHIDGVIPSHSAQFSAHVHPHRCALKSSFSPQFLVVAVCAHFSPTSESASLCIGHSTYKNTKMADGFFFFSSLFFLRAQCESEFRCRRQLKNRFTFRTICEVVKLCVCDIQNVFLGAIKKFLNEIISHDWWARRHASSSASCHH